MAFKDILVKYKIIADSSDVDKDLGRLDDKGEKTFKGISKDATKAADTTSKVFINSFKAIAASAAIIKLKNVFVDLIKSARNFETQMLGLQAAARQSGASFEDVRKTVIKLTADGTLGVNNVTTSMKLLLASGLEVDKAFELQESVKRISALNNILGDASQASQDFFKGVLTGSAELIENFSPNVRTVIRDVGGMAAVSSDATVRQELYNRVIQQGNDLLPDYQKFLDSSAGASARLASETENLKIELGGVLDTPVIEKGLGTLIKGFREWLEGMGNVSKGLVVLIPLLGGLAIAIKVLVASVPGLNLVALAIAGITVVLTGLTIGISKAISVYQEKNKVEKKSIEISKDQVKEYKKLIKIRDKTIRQTAQFKKLEKDLQKFAIDTGLANQFVNATLEERMRLADLFASEEGTRLRRRIIGLKGFILERTRLLKTFEKFEAEGGHEGSFGLPRGMSRLAFARAISAPEDIPIAQEKIKELQKQLIELSTVSKSISVSVSQPFKEGKKQAKIFSDFLDTDLEKKLNQIEKEYKRFLKTIGATSSEVERALALGVATPQMIAAHKERAKRISSAYTDEFLKAANRINTALEGAVDIKFSENIGQQISGLGKIFSAVDKQIGGIIGSIGGAIQSIISLFDDSEIQQRKMQREQDKIQKAREKELETIRQMNQLILDQLEFEKRIAEIARERGRLKDAALEKELRIIQLTRETEEEKLRASIRATAGREIELGGELGVERGDVRAIVDRQEEITSNKLDVENLIAFAQSINSSAPNADLVKKLRQLDQVVLSFSGTISAPVKSLIASMRENIAKVILSRQRTITEVSLEASVDSGLLGPDVTVERVETQVQDVQAIEAAEIGATGAFDAAISELEGRTLRQEDSVAKLETLFSLAEQRASLNEQLTALLASGEDLGGLGAGEAITGQKTLTEIIAEMVKGVQGSIAVKELMGDAGVVERQQRVGFQGIADFIASSLTGKPTAAGIDTLGQIAGGVRTEEQKEAFNTMIDLLQQIKDLNVESEPKTLSEQIAEQMKSVELSIDVKQLREGEEAAERQRLVGLQGIANFIASALTGRQVTAGLETLPQIARAAQTEEQIEAFDSMVSLLLQIRDIDEEQLDETKNLVRTIELPEGRPFIDLSRGLLRTLGLDIQLVQERLKVSDEVLGLSVATQKAETLQEQMLSMAINTAENTEGILDILTSLRDRLGSTTTNIDFIQEVITALDELRAGALS